jgi:hypothetical protein
MTVQALLQKTERLGIRLVLAGDRVKAIGPPSLSRELAGPLLDSLRRHRLEIRAILRNRQPLARSPVTKSSLGDGFTTITARLHRSRWHPFRKLGAGTVNERESAIAPPVPCTVLSPRRAVCAVARIGSIGLR